jgi:hypothetical protein
MKIYGTIHGPGDPLELTERNQFLDARGTGVLDLGQDGALIETGAVSR